MSNFIDKNPSIIINEKDVKKAINSGEAEISFKNYPYYNN